MTYLQGQIEMARDVFGVPEEKAKAVLAGLVALRRETGVSVENIAYLAKVLANAESTDEQQRNPDTYLRRQSVREAGTVLP